MAEEQVRLTRSQQRLVQAVYDRFGATGTWPTFDEIDRLLYRGRAPLDVSQVARTIPVSILPGFQRGWHDPSKQMRLTFEGIAACAGSDDDVERFLAALRYAARRWRTFKPKPGQPDASPIVDRRQVARALRVPKTDVIPFRRLGKLLRAEFWGWDVAGGPARMAGGASV